MLYKHVRLHKGLGVKQKLNSLSGCQLPLHIKHQLEKSTATIDLIV